MTKTRARTTPGRVASRWWSPPKWETKDGDDNAKCALLGNFGILKTREDIQVCGVLACEQLVLGSLDQADRYPSVGYVRQDRQVGMGESRVWNVPDVMHAS